MTRNNAHQQQMIMDMQMHFLGRLHMYAWHNHHRPKWKKRLHAMNYGASTWMILTGRF